MRVLTAAAVLFPAMQLGQAAAVGRSLLQAGETGSSGRGKQCSDTENSETDERSSAEGEWRSDRQTGIRLVVLAENSAY